MYVLYVYRDKKQPRNISLFAPFSFTTFECVMRTDVFCHLFARRRCLLLLVLFLHHHHYHHRAFPAVDGFLKSLSIRRRRCMELSLKLPSGVHILYVNGTGKKYPIWINFSLKWCCSIACILQTFLLVGNIVPKV